MGLTLSILSIASLLSFAHCTLYNALYTVYNALYNTQYSPFSLYWHIFTHDIWKHYITYKNWEAHGLILVWYRSGHLPYNGEELSDKYLVEELYDGEVEVRLVPNLGLLNWKTEISSTCLLSQNLIAKVYWVYISGSGFYWLHVHNSPLLIGSTPLLSCLGSS